MKITKDFLTNRGACSEQVALFRKTFPRGATINDANLLKANMAGLSLYWLIRQLRGKALDTIPYTTIEHSKPARAFYKLDRQQDKELDRTWNDFERKRNLAYKQRNKRIAAYERDRDLSANEVARLTKIEHKQYSALVKVLRKEDRQNTRAVKRKYRAELRKLAKAKDLHEAKVLIPYVYEAVALYEAAQQDNQ